MDEEKITYDTSYDETCPHCGEKIDDIWEYFVNGWREVRDDCPHCGKPIVLEAVWDVHVHKGKGG